MSVAPNTSIDALPLRHARLIAQLLGRVLDATEEQQLALACAAMSPNSLAARCADLASFARHLALQNVSGGLPVREADVLSFIVRAGELQRRPSSVTRLLATLVATQELLGLPGSVRSPSVKLALKAYRRVQGGGQRQALALRLGQGIGAASTRSNRPVGLSLTALLAACGDDVQGLRDAALLSLGYDGGLRVSELTGVACAHIERDADDGSGLLFLPRSKTDQSGQGAYVWLSPDTMRRVARWQEASNVDEGLLLRRVHVLRRKARAARPAIAVRDLAWHAKLDGAKLLAQPARPAEVVYTVGTEALTRQGVTHIYRRCARSAVAQGLVDIEPRVLQATIAAISSHSLRVGLTQDLFAAGEDAGPVAQALRWRSTATALRYARALTPKSNAAARVLGKVRG
jgi:integrase